MVEYGLKGVVGRSEMLVRGRQRLGWMDGVKVALSSKGMTGEVARQYAKDRKEWKAMVHISTFKFYVTVFCLVHVFFRIDNALWWLITRRGVGCRYMIRFG